MRRRMMKSKIHRATVSDANLHYVGSITLDTELMALADIRESIRELEYYRRTIFVPQPGPDVEQAKAIAAEL